MALPSYVVYSMEGNRSGLHCPYVTYTQVATIGESGEFGQILSGVDSFKSGVVENADAMCLRRGD